MECDSSFPSDGGSGVDYLGSEVSSVSHALVLTVNGSLMVVCTGVGVGVSWLIARLVRYTRTGVAGGISARAFASVYWNDVVSCCVVARMTVLGTVALGGMITSPVRTSRACMMRPLRLIGCLSF